MKKVPEAISRYSASSMRKTAASRAVQFAFLLFVLMMAYCLLYFNRSVTDVGGFDAYAVQLMKLGEVPYRDFYYYVPPVYLLRDYVVYSLVGNSVLLFRLAGIFERIAIFIVLYVILLKWMSPRLSFITSYLGFLVFNSFRLNSYGDYTQFSLLLIELSFCCALRFSELLDSQGSHARSKHPMMWAFFAGVIGVQASMTKQNIGLAGLVAVLVSMCIYACSVSHPRMAAKTCAFCLVGFGVGLAPYLVWLISNDVLRAFFEQVMLGSANAKGVSGAPEQSAGNIAKAVGAVFSGQGVLTMFLVMAAALGALSMLRSALKRTWQTTSMVYILMVGAVVMVAWTGRADKFLSSLIGLVPFLANDKSILLYVGLAVVLSIVLFSRLITLKDSETSLDVLTFGIGAICLGSFVMVSGFSSEQLAGLVSQVGFEKYASDFMEMAFFAMLGIFLADVILRVMRQRNFLPLNAYYLVALSIASVFPSLVGSGSGSFAPNSSLFSVPTLVLVNYYLALELRSALSGARVGWSCESAASEDGPNQLRTIAASNTSAPLGLIVGLACCIIGFQSMVDRFNCPYSFYGWTSQATGYSANYEIDVEGYEGLRVNKIDKVTIEQIVKLIEDNTTSTDEVYVFAQGRQYNVLTSRLDRSTFALAHFFDICPDAVAQQDAQSLAANPPAMIVWKEYGAETWEYYETTYRGGSRLGQRDIEEWFEDVRDTDYTLVGSVYNEKIYLRNDLPVRYTYFASEGDNVSSLDEVSEDIRLTSVVKNLKGILADHFGSNIPFYLILAVVLLAAFISGFGLSSGWSLIALYSILMGFVSASSYVYFFVALAPIIASRIETKEVRELLLPERIVLAGLWIISICAVFQWSDWWVVPRTILWISAAFLLTLLIIRGCFGLRNGRSR